MIKNDLKEWPKVISLKDDHDNSELVGTTIIQIEVPAVPRWLSDILAKLKSESVDYTMFKAKYDLTMIIHEDIKQLSWIEKNQKIVDLAVALGVWVVDDTVDKTK